MHPNTQLRWINPEIGYGVFATASVPLGTIVYVEDALDIRIRPDSALLHHPAYKEFIDKYATIDRHGNRSIAWDIGKYVNHCCHYNCLTTGYDFEMAVRDIQAGEEVTDEYGIFNPEEEMSLCGHYADCRRALRPDDWDRYADQWDAAIQAALPATQRVPQPLLKYVEPQVWEDLRHYLATGQGYRSVRVLRAQVQ